MAVPQNIQDVVGKINQLTFCMSRGIMPNINSGFPRDIFIIQV